jgi:DNA polymerase IV (archaeal DinB-like DNA polymerase)
VARIALPRVIIHLDMDAFYSSVEQRENPSLKGKPVIVGADPREGKARGVVMGCSYEAREFGVHSAMPISVAYRLCPNGVYLKPNFGLYEEASERIMRLLRTFSEKLEQISIDEAFLDITEKVTSFEAAAVLARAIKEQVHSKENLSCSIGIAPNKAIAKIASDSKKPDGLTIIPPEKVREFLDPLPVSRISGVGKKSSELLGQMGIVTIRQLATTHPSRLSDAFGKYGIRIWQVANGTDEEGVISSSAVKSISSEITFDEDIQDKGKIMAAFGEIVGDVHARLQSQRLLYRTVGIKVRLENFETFTRARTHTKYTNERSVIEDYVRELFREFESSPRKIRLVGVRVSGLRRLGPEQETILSWANAKKIGRSLTDV